MKHLLLSMAASLVIAVCGSRLAAQSDYDFQPLIDKHFTADEQAAASKGLAAATYMTAAEQDAIAFANLARMYPLQFDALYLDWLKEDDDETHLEKYEGGDSYYTSFHADLCKLKPQPPLVPSKKYWKCARFWARYSGKRGLVGHNRPWYPVKYQAEVCDYNYTNDPMHMVMDLLIDEKVKSLGHRRILLGKYQLVGASIQPHSGYAYCLVMDFGNGK